MAERGLVSVDGEEYVPRSQWEQLREERDRLRAEVERLQKALSERERAE